MGIQYLALDPGVTTGTAALVNDHQPAEIVLGQVTMSHRNFYQWLTTMNPQTLIVERFVYQRRDKVELYPVEVIGVINLWAENTGQPIYMQSPSQAKGLFDDKKLKTMGLWKPGQKHAMDAVRHLMYYLVITKGENKWLDPLKPEVVPLRPLDL